MKNIHLIPTDNKLSRLYFNINDKEYQICEIEKPSTILKPNRHIYITSNEEIKEGDWVINLNSPYEHKELCRIDNQIELERYVQKTGNDCKKIILTTDQDLIKDGVQAIDDEFLEWFVKNPSCETVNTEKVGGKYFSNGTIGVINYEIIIPKEEPKQEDMITKIMQMDAKMAYDSLPKQETLEEVASNLAIKSVKEYMKTFPSCDNTFDYRKGFEEGFIECAKWQQERSYSEEEVLEFCEWFAYELKHYDYPTNENILKALKALKQFKKK
jgi:hypothetical protein